MAFSNASLTMTSDKIPHDSFREGFIVGYQLLRGIRAVIPFVPVPPDTPRNMTPFLMGIKAGLRAAGMDVVGRNA
jgi:hypothetical protein